MSKRPYAIGGLALLLILGFMPGRAAASPQEAQQTPPAAAAELAPAAEQTPVAQCSDCHETVKAFLANPHARGEVKDGQVPNAVCESCHGDATAHMEAGGDTSLVKVPRGLEGSDATCRTCHDVSTDRRSHQFGVHANSQAVNCLSCHSVHHAQPRSAHLLRLAEPALCANCHGTQAASFRNKPYAHRIGRGGMECSSCHEPHGRPGKENLRLTKAGEAPCLGCHAEVRGPHVFPHGAIAAGECTNCHEPHGSSNPKQLKRATVYQLCLECHSPMGDSTLGSQPPAFHNLNNPRYMNCTTCHVAVHGSNRSPALLK
jgi:DmsE family decaheme c-type cytochrome